MDIASATARPRSPARSSRLDLALVFSVAVGARLWMIADSPGGWNGVFGYDAGVYYASADALIHGRLPYRDFVLLHPPGISLLLAPFALLGRLSHDHTGFQSAVLFCTLLSAASATLVTLTARRLGIGRLGGMAGGLFLALWYGTLTVDYAPRLEGFGTFLFLLAAYWLVGAGRKAAGAAGVAIGVAVLVKIWWVLPLVIIGVWLARTDRARALRFAAGAVASLAVIGLPFFLAAPSAMWRMVVVSQAIRTNSTTFQGHLLRVNVLSSISFAAPTLRGPTALLVAVLTVLLFAVLFWVAWRCRAGRIVVVVAAAQLVLLVSAPSYLSYYSGFVAGGFALTVAAAVHAVDPRWRTVLLRAPAALTVFLAAALTVTGVARFGNAGITVFPNPAQAGSVAARVRCVLADSPAALINLDVLSRGLQNGCPNWADVSGVSHVQDIAVGHETARITNPRWQKAIVDYLLSGDAFITNRGLTGLSAASRRRLGTHPEIARVGRFRLRRV